MFAVTVVQDGVDVKIHGLKDSGVKEGWESFLQENQSAVEEVRTETNEIDGTITLIVRHTEEQYATQFLEAIMEILDDMGAVRESDPNMN